MGKSRKKANKNFFYLNILKTTNLAAEMFYMSVGHVPLKIKNIIAFNLLVDILRKAFFIFFLDFAHFSPITHKPNLARVLGKT